MLGPKRTLVVLLFPPDFLLIWSFCWPDHANWTITSVIITNIVVLSLGEWCQVNLCYRENNQINKSSSFTCATSSFEDPVFFFKDCHLDLLGQLGLIGSWSQSILIHLQCMQSLCNPCWASQHLTLGYLMLWNSIWLCDVCVPCSLRLVLCTGCVLYMLSPYRYHCQTAVFLPALFNLYWGQICN